MHTIGSARSAGPLVKEWRQRRRRSQLDLALESGVSARHLSFVETGRSRPSPELLLALSDHLEIPLRERNTLLLAAGFAPRYPETPLGDASMTRARGALRKILDSHSPYPGLVIDRKWNSVVANDSALRMIDGLCDEVIGPPTNVFRVSLHPEGLAGRTRNLAQWSGYLLAQLHRLVVLTADPEMISLEEEVTLYPNIASLGDSHHRSFTDESPLLIPWCLDVDGNPHTYFTTLTSFGTPQDITLAELAIELFWPADEDTEAALRPDAVDAELARVEAVWEQVVEDFP